MQPQTPQQTAPLQPLQGTITNVGLFTVNTRYGQKQKAVIDVIDGGGQQHKVQAWEGKEGLIPIAQGLVNQQAMFLVDVKPANDPQYPPDVTARAITPAGGGMPQQPQAQPQQMPVQPGAQQAYVPPQQQQPQQLYTPQQGAQPQIDVNLAQQIAQQKEDERSQKMARGAAAKVAMQSLMLSPANPPEAFWASFYQRMDEIAHKIETGSRWGGPGDAGYTPGQDTTATGPEHDPAGTSPTNDVPF